MARTDVHETAVFCLSVARCYTQTGRRDDIFDRGTLAITIRRAEGYK
jgi:hypothetical protein